ncbi:unnamed protein product [Vicia faba]|uniref:Uncharacterized protein n=1 Tax=Vicia faba TaxID=3906 RepID=A0AAV1AGD1_VICFA|nr:unnamed protein product [Vicia faba]
MSSFSESLLIGFVMIQFCPGVTVSFGLVVIITFEGQSLLLLLGSRLSGVHLVCGSNRYWYPEEYFIKLLPPYQTRSCLPPSPIAHAISLHLYPSGDRDRSSSSLRSPPLSVTHSLCRSSLRSALSSSFPLHLLQELQEVICYNITFTAS